MWGKFTKDSLQFANFYFILYLIKFKYVPLPVQHFFDGKLRYLKAVTKLRHHLQIMKKCWAGSGTYLNFIKYKMKQTLILETSTTIYHNLPYQYSRDILGPATPIFQGFRHPCYLIKCFKALLQHSFKGVINERRKEITLVRCKESRHAITYFLLLDHKAKLVLFILATIALF